MVNRKQQKMVVVATTGAAAAAVLHNAHNNFVHLKRVGQPDRQTERLSQSQ